MMKRMLCTFLLAMALLAGCSMPEASVFPGVRDSSNVIRLATDFTADSAGYQQLQQFARLLEEKSDGAWKVQLYQSGQWGRESSFLDYLRLDCVEMACMRGQSLADQAPAYAVYGLPYLFSSPQEAAGYMQGFKGAEALAVLPAPWKGISLVNDGYLYLLEENGMRSWESFSALKKRAQVKGFLEGTFITASQAYYQLHVVLAQQSWWDGLHEDTQQWITEAMQESLQWSWQQPVSTDQQAALLTLGVSCQPLNAEIEHYYQNLLGREREAYFAQNVDELTVQWRPNVSSEQGTGEVLP